MKRLLFLIGVACLQTGCWTVYHSREARQPPPSLPANPDGVCPAIASGRYPGMHETYLGTVTGEDKALVGIMVPASWPRPTTWVERLDSQRLRVVSINAKGEIKRAKLVTSFKSRSVKEREGRVDEEFCDQGVLYHKSTGIAGPGGNSSVKFFSIDTKDMEYMWTVSKGENEEIVVKTYVKTHSRPFYIFSLGTSRRVETKRYPRVSDKLPDFDALKAKPKTEERAEAEEKPKEGP